MPPAGSGQGVGGSVNSDEEDSDAAGSVELDDEDMDLQLNGQTFDMSDDDPAEDESPPDSDSDSPEDSEPEGVEILGQKPSRTVADGAKLNGEQTLSELNLMPPGFGQCAVGCGLIGQKTVGGLFVDQHPDLCIQHYAFQQIVALPLVSPRSHTPPLKHA